MIQKKLMRFWLFIFLFTLINTPSGWSSETCSRTAIINFQEVLIDTDSTRKGEGLRFYLEKDELALAHLDNYQQGTRIQWHTAAMGTAGTSLILASLFVNSTSDSRGQLTIGGATLLILNYLISKTLETANEQNLIKAIDEYNKRNLPRIELVEPRASTNDRWRAGGLILSKSWDF
jgi:hypothetical protein